MPQRPKPEPPEPDATMMLIQKTAAAGTRGQIGAILPKERGQNLSRSLTGIKANGGRAPVSAAWG
jgi:hypothetical protein